MLSIIISSYQPDYFTALEKNIAETCGVPYEIIKVDNPGIMGICEAYNRGADKAKFENLLFLHEDVKFETKDWGSLLVEFLANEEVGCVGIAGSQVKTKFPIAWWEMDEHMLLNLNQVTSNNEIINYRINNTINQAILIDGVFIGVRKEVWNDVKFDEKGIKGFHGYDIDFSARTSLSKKNFIINKILLTHFSEGKIDKKWFRDIINIYKSINTSIKVPKVRAYSNVEVIEKHLRYYSYFKLSYKEKFLIFFSFYKPTDFSLMDNLKILNLFKFYATKK